MNRAPRRAACAAALGWLALAAGCASSPKTGDDWLAGRLTVKVAATANEPARQLSSAFELRGDRDSGELRLSSPLGTLLAAASWAPGQARLVTSDGEQRFDDIEALAHEALGEALPLRALPAWLRGQPWGGAPSLSTAAGFEQLGWQIGLQRFDEGWLDISRSAAPAVLLRARLERAT